MAFPEGLTLITVTGQVAGLPDDQPGAVAFRWPWSQGPDGEFLADGTSVVQCDLDGEFSVALPATNQPGWTPAGWQYDVQVFRGARTYRGSMTLPYDGGSPVELADRFQPNDPADAGQIYALVGHTHPGGGGGTAWADITGKPATFPPDAHTQAISTITGLSAQLAALTPLTTFGDLEDRVEVLEAAPGGGAAAATFSRGYLAGTGTDVSVPADASWTPVSGVSWSIPAVAGDDIETDVRMLLDVGAAATDYFDLAVLVAGAPVRCASSGTATPATEGDPALYPSTSVRFRGSQTGMAFTAAAGDIAGGVVTFGLIHKGTGSAKVYRSDAFPLRYAARNDH